MEYYGTMKTKKKTAAYYYVQLPRILYICLFGLLFVFATKYKFYESIDHLFCSLLSAVSLTAPRGT